MEKEKQGRAEWDKSTVNKEKPVNANFEDRIAKHVADEILRNYKKFNVHSNQSIRKLLEREAKRQLAESIRCLIRNRGAFDSDDEDSGHY